VEVDDVADELYALAPEDFVRARDAAAATARAEGRRDDATAIAALRKPTVAAWLVNRIASTDPATLNQLLELADQMRAAGLRDAEEMRESNALRAKVVRVLAGRAVDLARADGRRVTPDVERLVEATLHAAMASPEAAELVRAGHLTEPLSDPGFGGLLDGAAPVRGTSAGGPLEPSTAAAPGGASEHERAAARAALREAQARARSASRTVEKAAEQVASARQVEATLREQESALAAQLDDLRSRVTVSAERVAAAEEAQRAAEAEMVAADAELAAAESTIQSLG
jgi:hypothetical protein